MKDKKTLITIIVLLVIFIPISIWGTINNFRVPNSNEDSNNPNKEFIYKDTLYFYDNDKLLATYQCSNCGVAVREVDEVSYHTNYYKLESNEIDSVINEYYGIFKENDSVLLFNLKKGSVLNKYDAIKVYQKNIAIVKNNNKWGVVFLDLSHKPIDISYDYITFASHINNGVLDISKFIVKKDNLWYVMDNDENNLGYSSNEEIVDFNDYYYITYSNNMYHIKDKNNLEYLSNMEKSEVYAVDKYIFVISNSTLYVYNNCNNPFIREVKLNSYNDIYFDVKSNGIDIILDGNLQETIELS